MSLDKWTSGEAYDQWMGRWSALLAAEFLDWLALPKGLAWLDVCCGSGVVTQAIVDYCAPKSVTGVDASEAQLAAARERCPNRGITFEVGDAMTLRFAEASFDVAVCCLGLNFIPEPERALREMRRVVRDGGVIAAYVWDYAQGARFLREFWTPAS